MSYGLQINSDAGTVLINEHLSNFELYEVGTRSFPHRDEPVENGTDTVYPNYSHLVEIEVARSINPLLFWHSPVPVTLFGIRGTETTIIFQVAASREFSNASGVQFQYFVFGSPRQVVDQAYGLVVRDASGAVVFNSNRKNMRMVTVQQSGAEAGQVGGFGGGRKFAAGMFQNVNWDEWRRRSGNLNIYNQMFSHMFVQQTADGMLWRCLRSHLRYTNDNIGGNRPKEIKFPGHAIMALIDVTGF